MLDFTAGLLQLAQWFFRQNAKFEFNEFADASIIRRPEPSPLAEITKP